MIDNPEKDPFTLPDYIDKKMARGIVIKN
jgi:hypothetical protein